VNSDTAERTIFHRRDPRLEWPPDLIVPDLSGCSLLLADNCYPPLGIAAARAARAQGIPVVADVSPKREYKEFLRHVDVWIASDKFPGLSAYSPEKALDAMHRLGPETVVLTRGDKGLVWSDPQGRGEGQAFRVEPRDTTGAGDAFHGAFAFATARGWDIGRCCEFSSAVAALNCTDLGCRHCRMP
jgi:sulfofructose kinase